MHHLRVLATYFPWLDRKRSSVCSVKFPFDPRVPFAFQLVEPDILA